MLAALGPGGDQPALRRRRPPPARLRRVLSRLRGPRRRRAAVAAEPRAAADRRRRMGRCSRPASSSAPSCSRRCSPMPMGRPRWCARAGCRPRSSPAIRNSCGRWSASRRPAARICASMPSTSAAAPTATGGCSATARRRRRAPAMRWRTGSRSRAPCPTSIARSRSSGWRRSSRRSRPSCRRSTAATIPASAC